MASTEQRPWLNASYTPDPKTQPGAYIEKMDISGGDLSSGSLPNGSTHVDCERKCNATAGCVAFVFAPAVSHTTLAERCKKFFRRPRRFILQHLCAP